MALFKRFWKKKTVKRNQHFINSPYANKTLCLLHIQVVTTWKISRKNLIFFQEKGLLA